MPVKSARWVLVLLIVTMAACSIPFAATRSPSADNSSPADSSYVMVGGQNGTWFKFNQAPRLEKIDLTNYSIASLIPAPTEGTVWGGGWNGSQWLISGWGEDNGPNGSNPYIFLYNGQNQVDGGSLDQYQAENTWHGGDIFAASANGKEWLLSGLGSGNLTTDNAFYYGSNHMSLALFDGSNFTDLSSIVPEQRDAILYANAWNGEYWLIGGGYQYNGALFSFDGKKIVDLTQRLEQAVGYFGSVQALSWNGYYWLIGGVNFLVSYDGRNFTDLTAKLDSVLEMNGGCCSSVNAIAWDGEGWILGGGTPIAQTDYGHAWLAKYANGIFTDLTAEVSPKINDQLPDSSILSIAATTGTWIIGGYFNGKGSLYEYTEGSLSNISSLVSNYTYVDWIGAHIFRLHRPTFGKPNSIIDLAEFNMPLILTQDWIISTIRPRNLKF